MEAIKIAGKSGQISLGKSLAGRGYELEVLATGDILLKHSVIVPAKEQWLHTLPCRENWLRQMTG